MNLLTNKEMLRNLLFSGDLLNTLHGGTAMTYAKVQKMPHEIVISISAPSVLPEAFHVLVEQNRLVVYSLLQHTASENERTRAIVPMFQQEFPLSAQVDAESIEAVYEEGRLRITLPLQPEHRRTQRRIDIRHL
ncbi:MAG: Hsp20/alpha crystallin family protein [Catalinimonas sp.]